MKKRDYISIPELAKFLGISRIAVFKKVVNGQIEAIRIGRNYAVPKEYIAGILGRDLKDKEKKEIEKAVKKTVREYGEVLKLLGRQ